MDLAQVLVVKRLADILELMLEDASFAAARRRSDGSPVEQTAMWELLDGFFPAEMPRQTLVPHAREALGQIAQHADIVILTNVLDKCRDHRIAQLSNHGIAHRVECNSGGKGTPVAQLVEEFRPSVTVFVDDLPVHHESVAKRAPEVHRLHMISEPVLAGRIPPAPHAHARIDDWREASDWILDRFRTGTAAA